MNLRFVSLLALSCSVAAQGVEIYSNAPLVSLPTGGFGGNPASILQAQVAPAGLGNNTFGYGAQVGVSNSLADDFAVNGTWLVDGIEVLYRLLHSILVNDKIIFSQRRDGPALLVNDADIQLHQRRFGANDVVNILGGDRSDGEYR